jgi:hypothetical protein
MRVAERTRKRNRQIDPVKIARPLQTLTRRLVRQTSISLQGWQDNANIQLSQDIQLDFKVTDFPGYASMAAIADHYRILNITHRMTKHYKIGATAASNVARTITLLTSYDKDGGTMNPLDILSRSNLKIATITMNQPTVVISGVPAYRDSSGRVVSRALLDAQGTQPDFSSFQIVGMCIVDPSDVIRLELISTIDVEFQGLR